ncbi:hypothetical protein FLL45_13275 [Aliikangiella marina]|uniref:Uncharacterized protein n=1 Tax=Aliikangiella marina TaxID=1712262 RepID=A0A545T9E2_9GAMM|nr:hypothetical protein [Aliikangiella marina]TQV73834.1 hypothetical protein FLL45_13275 [Aliikangiella marina]
MGYSIYIQKFENGDSANIPFNKFEEVLSKYGKVEDGNVGLEFVSKVGEICDFASIHGDRDSGVSGISFSRPTTHKALPFNVYDLLGLKNTCFFGPDLAFLQSRNDMNEHFPPSLIDGLSSGPEVIKSPTSSWPLK